MFENASNVRTGDISQVNTRAYYDDATSSNAVVVTDGGNYAVTNTVDIKAGVFNHQEVRVVDPLRELYAHVACGAMHNSEDRAEAPKCHPKTRKAVQENIFSWISHREEKDEPQQLLWLTGPAGTGKTAIMGTISDKLDEQGQLAASFYFASYTGSIERKSKRGFVTTLAYQLHQHPALKDKMSKHMLSAIQGDPAIFKRSLKAQMEALILHPLRHISIRHNFVSGSPLVVIIDGVDECGEDTYGDPYRLREKDQIEVLSLVLQALRDPTFPCRLIIASRPETWIRHFLDEKAANSFTEIFLDDKYDPDKDIELFLNSKFAELRRRYGLASFTWPRQSDIATLVQNASGQFIYAATVVRFVDTPGRSPKEQLDVVLSIKPLQEGPSPFHSLDALYTAVLRNTSPRPIDTIMWLMAHQVLRRTWKTKRARDMHFIPPPGQSIDYLSLSKDRLTSSSGWDVCYSFYHKSFLDYLEDPARCGVAFPEVSEGEVDQWIWDRFSRVLLCQGPEVPIEDSLLPTFKYCFVNIVFQEMRRSNFRIALNQGDLAKCDPNPWIQRPGFHDDFRFSGNTSPRVRVISFNDYMFILVHNQVSRFTP
ncbi:hypothetical protein NMY22_g5799 [Coprinellus aureogranulatus]|nr:hypothetical protein NMY22_g5799 [Coprinellus aureogranulatus]